MYPNYSHDDYAQHEDTCMRAVEGDQSHSLLQSGSCTVTTVANAPTTVSKSFSRAFSPNTKPDMFGSISDMGGYPSASIKNVVVTAISNTQYQVTVTSDTAATVTVTWHAKGVAG